MAVPKFMAAAALLGMGLLGCGGGPDDAGSASSDASPDGGSSNDGMRNYGGDASAPRAGSACQAEIDFFAEQVWEPVLAVKCIGCHNAQGQASGSRMVLQPDTREGYLEHNFEQVFDVASTPVEDDVLFLAMPSDTHPDREHPGGELVPADGLEYEQMQALVTRLWNDGCDSGDGAVDCSQPQPGPRHLRRLTPEQFDNTVRDLLDVEGSWGDSFPSDPVVEGFDNHAEELRVTPLLADKLQVAAEDIADRADLGALLPCDVATGSDACARDFIRSFGKRAFRRPLSEADVDRYAALYDAAQRFEAGSRLVITAMLQSPHFLYRSELGEPSDDGRFALTDHEIASELSYLIWDTMPDERLFEAADAGMLHTPEQIAEQAQRMLDDPKARPVLRRFVFEWLGLNRLRTVPKDAATFPALSNEIRAAMTEEAERLVDHVVYESTGTLPELITAPLGFVTPELAELYGVQAPDDATQPVDMPQRSGLLTQGGVMLTHARSNDSSPVHRGRLVRERFFCQVPPPPPPGINAEPPPLDPELTARERYSAHSQEEPCKSCHRLLDPIGFAFEKFDGIGRYREDQDGHSIDVSGEIVSTAHTNGTFEGTQELAETLAQSRDVQDCFALQWFRYGYGLSEGAQTRCTVETLQDAFQERELSIPGMVTALTQTAHFTTRVSGDTQTEDEPDDTGSDEEDAPDMPAPDAGTSDMQPMPDTGQTLERVQEDAWASGYCHTYEVTNQGDEPLTWSVTLDLMGTLSHNWESTVDGESGEVTFTGIDRNRMLDPGGSARFGFCVDH